VLDGRSFPVQIASKCTVSVKCTTVRCTDLEEQLQRSQ
jgi:hypothetical protein